MNQALLQYYYRLPYALKVLGATIEGVRLNRWRYGPETDELVAAALEREAWTSERWKSWQEAQLAEVLHRAATCVPYYRAQWTERRSRGDRASWEYLENWPVLTKEPLRKTPEAFFADEVQRRQLHVGHTSGTTGTSVALYASRAVMRQYWALVRARHIYWYGLSERDAWASMGGKLVTAISRQRAPFWVWNLASKQLYLSSYHLMPGNIAAYVDALHRYRVRYIVGYPSSLHSLAVLSADQGLRLPKLSVVISNAEPLYAYRRNAIESAFQCPVQDTYGMGEWVCAANECAHGRLHLWPEVGAVQVMDSALSHCLPLGQVGRLICTSLIHTDMMLIRYDAGDLGALASDCHPCACGRNMPALAQIEGRSDDVIITPEGRRAGRLTSVFQNDLHVREAQIIQETTSTLRVRYVPSPGYTKEDSHRIVEGLSQRVGQMEILLEAVEHIERGANGKFRTVISKL